MAYDRPRGQRPGYDRPWDDVPERDYPDPQFWESRRQGEPRSTAWWGEHYADRPMPGYGIPFIGGWYGQPRHGGYPRGHWDRQAPRHGGEGRDFWDRASDEVSSWFGDEDAERRRERDRHRGKGPKGYRRSDERILDDVSDRMMDDGALDASDIDVTVSDGEVTLTGFVTDRFEKRRAEDCADSVSGVRHTQNNLRIREAASEPGNP